MSTSTVVLEPPPSKPHQNQKNHHPNNANSKRKSKHDRSSRKRSKSFSGCGIINMKPVPPTKFLLGGNINDPLNLNSLQDEEINRAMNAITPKSSPIPTPPRRKGQIEVIIPPNIRDPLNLIDCADEAEYEQQLYSPVKKGRKKRLKKRRTVSASLEVCAGDLNNSEAKTPETRSDSAKIPPEEEPASKNCNQKDLTLELSPKKEKGKRKLDEHNSSVSTSSSAKKFKYSSMDKIVSPVVPQPGSWSMRANKMKPRHNKTPIEKMPLFKDKDKQFQFGNYNRYYGYRYLHTEVDPRLKIFSQYRYLFKGKDILDIGCNIGHVTLSVARDFDAKTVTGIDIDPKLISIARKNVKHYVKNSNSPDSRNGGEVVPKKKKSSFNNVYYTGPDFPNNVTFKTCNYVLEDDALLVLEQPQYDVILCLSTTKWIHLNWGDAGVKQAFRRMYAQLRPGGKLILESQNWASYKSKRKLTETIFKNYNLIEFFPEKFTEYLLSSVVGFAKSEILGFPQHPSKGFRRPLQIFTKSTMFPSERIEATPNNITPSNPTYEDNLDQKLLKTEKYEAHTQPQMEKAEHIYTNILNRFCGDSDANFNTNNLIGEELSHEVKTNDVETGKISCNKSEEKDQVCVKEIVEDDLSRASENNT